jgi:hypothetical protein
MPSHKIHLQQLFHWIGSNLDEKVSGSKLSESLRRKYLDYLRGALKHGLWAKTPRIPDQLGDGSLIKVHRPITCFTEWSLDQSHPHTRIYGRLGFGFPKRFVLERGGQPVTYVRDARNNDPYTAALLELARWLKAAIPETSGLTPKKLKGIRSKFDYLSHFNKRIRRQNPRLTLRDRIKEAPIVMINFDAESSAKALMDYRVPDPFIRRYGPTLHYLEEREWRIVYDVTINKFFSPGPGTPGPEFYIPFEPGKQLFTLVVPDNAILNAAIHDKEIRQALFPRDAPHVTLLSFEDIGTF